MKRRIFALLAALCLLAGCAGKTEPDAPVVDPAPPTVDPTPVTPTEPSEAEQAEARLRERIAGMSIEEKVGQMFFVRCPETGAAEDVAALRAGLQGRRRRLAERGGADGEARELSGRGGASALHRQRRGGRYGNASEPRPEALRAAAALAAGAVCRARHGRSCREDAGL